MAPPSPRRSSRARAPNSQSQQSSASSATSVRLERTTRSLNKVSPTKSTPTASLSSEPLDEADDSLLGRRRKRGQDEEPDKNPKIDAPGMAHGSDDLPDEEDEAVRCICGSEDYPGRPPVEGPDADLFTGIELTEDVTGFFVQCDICKVWQHGACVGIFSAESSPDEYFCDQCRKDLHRINAASNGQKYSKYLPLHRPSQTTSRSTSITKDSARSPKNGASKTPRPNSGSQASKRRSTMNSRDAAYDDELLRRVIEASKEDVVHEAIENPTRRAKRGRSCSEENNGNNNNTNVKRQRTGSRSVSPPAEQPPEASKGDGSDDEAVTRNGAKKSKGNKGHRDKSDKEEKERHRQEAANKRKGRAERRRAEDSEVSEEMPLNHGPNKTTEPAVADDNNNNNATATATAATATTTTTTTTTVQRPGTPPTSHPTTSSSHKRGARSNHKKGKGKIQHSKDREPDKEASPARSTSRETVKNADDATGNATKSSSGADGKHSKNNKQAPANKLSMFDMKRRVAAIMEFISRTQVDMATENGGSSGGGHDAPAQGGAAEPCRAGHNGDSGSGSSAASSDTDKFRELSCIEMMDVLTRDMVKWQNHYA
ncbi:hypothetical protein L249_2913 [Ophiocordyceps polyrhachis-furcata BCC 54312]|uniref:Zinc finger PHD-type domain-containing protein n=1 Tax=Ophiocordyceps polyrhachis-furcata BCC 54312 TaxID=1330021 RepID=A0A367LMX0_9HYPO|nr:hypothetical protein L249_2913 [Ophiocordyceps polyrhachis-furcata BCC 54312]